MFETTGFEGLMWREEGQRESKKWTIIRQIDPEERKC